MEVGGWNALMEGYPNSIPSVLVPNSTCGIPRDDAFHIFRDPVNSDLPWPGVIIGMSIPSMWYWCSDQVRIIGALQGRLQKTTVLFVFFKLLSPCFICFAPFRVSFINYKSKQLP